VVESGPPRSWLYTPGHLEKLLGRVFEAGADAVVLDLEDAVPEVAKGAARSLVAAVVAERPAWVRINAPGSDAADADLAAVVPNAAGLRIPKVESAADVEWVARRAPGVPLVVAIESARGVLSVAEIAAAAGVVQLAFGAADLALDLGVAPDSDVLDAARCGLVLGSRAAGRAGPADGAYTGPDDEERLRSEAVRARSLGFTGKSAVRPWHVPVLNAVFAPSKEEIAWAERVVACSAAAGDAAARLDTGELVDRPVVERARRLLRVAR
jgi:citrate lyase subunit beta / citryl-CoA lyase